jgi:enoyl-CoA hydratase
MIEVSSQDGVALLRMADGKANTMSTEFCREVAARVEEVGRSPARAVVITGNGRIFSAGVDLIRLRDGGVPYVREFLPALSTMLRSVFVCPKPVVAAINGHAIAGGCVLACAADRRLMEIMRAAVAPQYFEDTILSGATFAPPEAVTRGLVHDIVEPDALLDRAIAAATTLAALPPAAFALTKRQLRAPTIERLDDKKVDAAIARIWEAPETLGRVRDYVERTLRKS